MFDAIWRSLRSTLAKPCVVLVQASEGELCVRLHALGSRSVELYVSLPLGAEAQARVISLPTFLPEVLRPECASARFSAVLACSMEMG